MIARAVASHQAGRLREAEALYQHVLSLDRHNSDALHLLGVLAHQVGQPAQAVRLIKQAADIAPQVPVIHVNLGNALRALGRLPDALAAYDTALRLQPDLAGVEYNRSLVLKALDRPDDALAACDAAVRLQPDLAEAHAGRAALLKGFGRLEEALHAYETAARLKPGSADIHSNRGNVLRGLRRWQDARQAYDDALKLRPDFPEALCNKGILLKDLGYLQEALQYFDRALSLQRDLVEAHSSRGNTLSRLGQLDAALAALDCALHYRPDYAEAWSNRGNVLMAMARWQDAEDAYKQALLLRPDHAEAHFNRGLLHLLLGDFAVGWAEHEWRWKMTGPSAEAPRHQALPLWQGEEGAGRILLLWAEQGLGDTIQFLRYVPQVVARGWSVILEVPAPLLPLCKGLTTPAVRCVAIGTALPGADAQCPLLSLPLYAGQDDGMAGEKGPYLAADPVRVDLWRKRLPGGRRIGIIWQGNPDHHNDKNRSVPLRRFAPLADCDGITLVSLQRNFGEEQIPGCAGLFPLHLPGEIYTSGGFDETAALIMALDLVISVDTSVAHLAGALGCPVWVLLPHVPDWRWLLNRDDSPWYPSMRLFRQPELGDWDTVFAQVAAALRTSA